MCTEVALHEEVLSGSIAWEPIRTIARSPNAGAKHFSSAGPDIPTLLDEFGGYTRQADDYFVGASHVPSPSAALLYYYCALQLAKAELLTSNASDIVGMKIGHGLSHKISDAGNPGDDYVTVRVGVFPLLYRKRTGLAIPVGTKLNVRDVLEYVPEVGVELQSALSVDIRRIPLLHALATNGEQMWTLIAVLPTSRNPPAEHTEYLEAELSHNFEEVEPHAQWRDIFGVSTRAFVPGVRLFQARRTLPQGSTIDDIAWAQTAPFKHSLDNCITDEADAFFWPTLNGLPMTASIARYVLMFYLSSIVRYKPGILMKRQFADYSTVLDTVVSRSGVNLVVNAADGITGKWQIYGVRHRV